MIARLGAKAVLLAIGLGMAFFGVGLLGLALAAGLKALFGTAGALAIAGGVLLLPPLFWALAKMMFRPAKPEPPSGLAGFFLTALAKQTPWLAMMVTELFFKRNRRQK